MDIKEKREILDVDINIFETDEKINSTGVNTRVFDFITLMKPAITRNAIANDHTLATDSVLWI